MKTQHGAQAATTTATPKRPDLANPPAPSGAWFEGDPVGERLFAPVGDLPLEAGGILPDVTLAYETWGELNGAKDNAVLVLHALTGDSHVKGPAGNGHATEGWWTELIGPGAALDTDEYFVIAPNVLGGCQGSTGPASKDPEGNLWGANFPFITVRDTVEAEVRLADALGIERWQMVIGGSMGGMRALEWAACYPDRVERVVPIATTAKTSADQIAWAHSQLLAISADPGFNGGNYYHLPQGQGPHKGLSLARQIAQTTYRSAEELEERFGQEAQGDEDPWRGGRYAVQSYLEYQGEKFVRRFDANSYRTLTEMFMSHDLGRGRGGLEAALAEITAHTLVVAVDSDRLCFPEESAVIADGVPNPAGVELVRSHRGHDGFLIEFHQFGPLIKDFLERPAGFTRLALAV